MSIVKPQKILFKELRKINNLVEEFKNIDLKQFVNVEKLTKYAQGAISIASGIFDFFVSIIVSVYILLERTEIVRFIKKLTKSIFDEDIYNNINKYFDRTNEIFLKFLARIFQEKRFLII